MFLRQWLQFAKEMWSHRNDFLHIKSAQRNRQQQEEEINGKVISQFHLGTQDLPKQDQYHILDNEIEKILGMDIKRKSQWVENVECARRKRRKVESAEMSRMRRFLREWCRGS